MVIYEVGVQMWKTIYTANTTSVIMAGGPLSTVPPPPNSTERETRSTAISAGHVYIQGVLNCHVNNLETVVKRGYLSRLLGVPSGCPGALTSM